MMRMMTAGALALALGGCAQLAGLGEAAGVDVVLTPERRAEARRLCEAGEVFGALLSGLPETDCDRLNALLAERAP